MHSPLVLIVGGGSLGHIAPGIAVAQELRTRSNASVVFVCGPHPREAAFIEAHGFRARALDAPRLDLYFPLLFLRALRDAMRVLRSTAPNVVFSKGGYVSVPLCLAAWWRGTPIVLHESDSVSGHANRLMSFLAREVCRGCPPTEDGQGASKTTFTGNPVRHGIAGGDRGKGLALTELSGERPILLVLGGSQGARALNDALWRHLDELLGECDVVHLTGEGKERDIERQGYHARAFATEELPHLYALADLAVSRAGAGAISELGACGIPMVLVPLRGVGHDHQRVNALALERAGACVVCEQDALDRAFVETVRMLLRDPERRAALAGAARALDDGEASGRIVNLLLPYLAADGNVA